jgi:hypothetical protein
MNLHYCVQLRAKSRLGTEHNDAGPMGGKPLAGRTAAGNQEPTPGPPARERSEEPRQLAGAALGHVSRHRDQAIQALGGPAIVHDAGTHRDPVG